MATFNARRLTTQAKAKLAQCLLLSLVLLGVPVIAQEAVDETTISQINLHDINNTTQVAVINTNNYQQESCASAAHVNSTSVSTTDDSGLYELIQVASTREQPIEITSTGSCTTLVDTSTVDTAENINVLYRQTNADGSDIETIEVSSTLNFVARTQIALAEGILHSEFDVQFSLTSNSEVELSAPVSYDETNQQYWYDFGRPDVGDYSLLIRVTHRESDEIKDESYFIKIEDEALPTDATVYENNGELFIFLPDETHNIKLTTVNGVWVVEMLNDTEWENYAPESYAISDYVLSFGDFVGNNLDDIKLVKGEGDNALEILIERTDTDYNVVAPISVSYQYDALGRLKVVTDPKNGNRDYTYDKAGNRITAGNTGAGN